MAKNKTIFSVSKCAHLYKTFSFNKKLAIYSNFNKPQLNSAAKSKRMSGVEVGNMIDKKLDEPSESESSKSSESSYMRKLKSPVVKQIAKQKSPSPKSWLIKVYTSDLEGRKMEGTDANVYISLIGPNSNETGNLMLDKKLAKSNNKDLFEAGQRDEFTLTTLSDIQTLSKIRIGHDNKGLGSGWHLNKVEVVDLDTNKSYLFKCNRWFDKKEDDGKIERILDADKSNDDDDDSDSVTPTPMDNGKRSNHILSPVQKPKPNEHRSPTSKLIFKTNK